MTTATVETITAEVRVLMVGNRQVTLSVYRQLDTVDLRLMSPFGRINDPAQPAQAVWVVGRSVADGTLVRSRVSKDNGPFSVLPGDLNALPFAFCRFEADPNGWHRVSHDGAVIRVDPRRVTHCDAAEHVGRGSYCRGTSEVWSRVPDELLVSCLNKFVADERRLHRAAAGLPLIVLAGLR